ncbi:hypothetical protein EVA_18081 [gut metagenome]|uniref:Uncharacterized protein n=1 Tax=gut metagenome TaxID=749906 RepID=J9FW62_9ZZZZ
MISIVAWLSVTIGRSSLRKMKWSNCSRFTSSDPERLLSCSLSSRSVIFLTFRQPLRES